MISAPRLRAQGGLRLVRVSPMAQSFYFRERAVTALPTGLWPLRIHQPRETTVCPIDARTAPLTLSDDDTSGCPNLSHVVFDYRKSLYEHRVNRHVYFRSTGRFAGDHDSRWRQHEVGTIATKDSWDYVCLGDRDAPSSVTSGSGRSHNGCRSSGELDRNQTLSLICFAMPMLLQPVAQSAACAHLHRVEQRCCRWL